MVGNCVWNTDTRPPVGVISLYAACSAGPRALWVSRVCVNILGNAFNRSFTSYTHTHRLEHKKKQYIVHNKQYHDDKKKNQS